jgi:uncharacterized protein
VRRIIVLTAIVLVSCSALVGAQAGNSSESPASREDILKFMDVLHIQQTLVQLYEGMGRQAKVGAEQAFKEKIPDASPEQLAAVDKFAEGLFKDMPVEEIVEAMVPIYQKHLTKSDMDGILAFYSSPAGQKLLREQPAMMQEGMEVGSTIGQKRMHSIMEKMDEFIAELIKQEQQKRSGDKK